MCLTSNQSVQQQEMIKLVTSKPLQQRTVLNCNNLLMREAQKKAIDMIKRGYYGHVDPDGHGMNYTLKIAGYPLPSYYQQNIDANNVEALAAGPDFNLAQNAFQGFLNSPKHRSQILGLSTGWAAQDEYGIGFAISNNSKYTHYWVVIIAKQED
jgi:uncharacterized protein YkwD